MVDERFHLRLHLFAVRQHHCGASAFHRPRRHAFQRLLDDASGSPHFLHAHLVAREHVVFGARGHFEIELLVARIGLVLRTSFTPAARSIGPVTPRIEHVFEEMKPTPLVRPIQMRLLVSRFRIRPPRLGKAVDEFLHAICQPRGGSSASPPMRK
jgi:hypothetical protein